MSALRILEQTAFLWGLSLEMPWVLRAITQIRKTEQSKARSHAGCYLTDKRHAIEAGNTGSNEGLIGG